MFSTCCRHCPGEWRWWKWFRINGCSWRHQHTCWGWRKGLHGRRFWWSNGGNRRVWWMWRHTKTRCAKGLPPGGGAGWNGSTAHTTSCPVLCWEGIMTAEGIKIWVCWVWTWRRGRRSGRWLSIFACGGTNWKRYSAWKGWSAENCPSGAWWWCLSG